VIVVADSRNYGCEVRIIDRRKEPRYRATDPGNLCLGLVALLLVIRVRKKPMFEVLLDVVKLKDVLSPRRDFLGVELLSKFGYARDVPTCCHVIHAVEPNPSRGLIVFTHLLTSLHLAISRSPNNVIMTHGYDSRRPAQAASPQERCGYVCFAQHQGLPHTPASSWCPHGVPKERARDS
jgi:hypothetical protein